MTLNQDLVAPEHTAVRVALWRALHLQVDAEPHILIDEVGVKLIDEKLWRDRPDMNPEFSRGMRASVVGRARFIEDVVTDEANRGVSQYLILGAGLDTFAQRRADLASRMQIFEVDQPGPQAWKQKRLSEIGWVKPEWMHFVPVDFEIGQSWWQQVQAEGFNSALSAVVASTGVSMYLSKDANRVTFNQLAKMAPNSTFVTTFMLSLDLLDRDEKSVMEYVMKRAAEAGTPFRSLFTPTEMMDLAKSAGFKSAAYVSGDDLYQRYFAQRSDGLRAGRAEAFLLART